MQDTSSGLARLSRRQFATLVAGMALTAAHNAQAQLAGSDKPIRVILPLSAGSTVDVIARGLNLPMSKALGRNLFIENLPGAGGVTGSQQIARAPKDGSTIGMVSNNFAVNPSIFKKMPFDSVKDIAPVTVIGLSPFVLVVHKDLPVSNLKELIALAKARPGVLNYGSSGNGTILHLAGELLVSEARIDIKHIAYKGNGPLINDLLGGQVQMGFLGTAVAEPHIKSGAFKAIGISTRQRSALLPQVPTLAEQGLEHYDLGGWIAVVAPSGLPPAVLAALNTNINSAIHLPETTRWLVSQDVRPMAENLESTAQFFKVEFEKHAALVRQSGASAD